MNEINKLEEEIKQLQSRLSQLKKTETVKRPVGKLRFFIYIDDEEKEFDNETKWVNKLFSLAKKSNYLFVQYYSGFNKEKKSFDLFEKTWKNPNENDINDFLDAVYSTDDWRKVSTLEIGIANKKDEIMYNAWIEIPQVELFKKKLSSAEKNKDNSFFDKMEIWRMEYQ
jgi:hypothetical protein